MNGARVRTVDAFTETPFTGNPAAVVILDRIPANEWMAAVAREMGVSDTGFVIRDGPPDADFRLRWFTQGGVEVDLCGHATLAAAHCLFEDGMDGPVRFATRSGLLTVSKSTDGSIAMDFPAWPPTEIDPPPGIAGALDVGVTWTGRSGNDFLLALLVDEHAVRRARPDLVAVSGLPADVLVLTAVADAGRDYDFVSRVFAPNLGIDEDPVTGSAHTVLGPYWASRLGKTALVGLQASVRSGVVTVEVAGDRVVVGGRAVTILDGSFRAV